MWCAKTQVGELTFKWPKVPVEYTGEQKDAENIQELNFISVIKKLMIQGTA